MFVKHNTIRAMILTRNAAGAQDLDLLSKTIHINHKVLKTRHFGNSLSTCADLLCNKDRLHATLDKLDRLAFVPNEVMQDHVSNQPTHRNMSHRVGVCAIKSARKINRLSAARSYRSLV